MTKKSFLKFWNSHYPNTIPVQYLLKNYFTDKWLRIHSLPQSKRYPENEQEWKELFDRQFKALNYFLYENEPYTLLINSIDSSHFLFDHFKFKNIGVFVHDETTFQSFVATQKKDRIGIEIVLKEIAEDKIRGFFITPKGLFAPYDGGVDMIFENSEKRNQMKLVFKNWISPREDGL